MSIFPGLKIIIVVLAMVRAAFLLLIYLTCSFLQIYDYLS